MNLKKLRTNAGLSQAEVADKIGVSRATYLAWESSDREPRISEIRELARLFGISSGDLVEGRGPIELNVSFEKDMSQHKSEEVLEFRISVPQKKVETFVEVLLYILEKVGARPNVGETVVYKLLYFIDFDYYEKFEKQLIGATYIKNRFGPTPVEFKKIVEEMEERGELARVVSKYFMHEQKKYLPRRAPNLSKITAEQLRHIDDVLNRLAGFNATELSARSHKDVPWITAEEGKPIDYEAVFYRTPELSVRKDADSEYA